MNVSVSKQWCTTRCYVKLWRKKVTADKQYPTNHLNCKQIPLNHTSHSVSACSVYVVADAALSRLRVAPPPQDRSRTRLMSGTVSLNNDSEVGGDSPRVRDTVTDQDGSVYSFDTYKQGTLNSQWRRVLQIFSQIILTSRCKWHKTKEKCW